MAGFLGFTGRRDMRRPAGQKSNERTSGGRDGDLAVRQRLAFRRPEWPAAPPVRFRTPARRQRTAAACVSVSGVGS
jgi:hypothetical protein